MLASGAMLTAGAVPAAQAATDPAPADDAPAPELVVAAADPVLDAPDDAYAFSVVLRNPTEADLPAGTVTVSIERAPIEDAAELDADFAEAGAGDAAVAAEFTVGVTGAGDEQTAETEVSSDDFPLRASDDPGVYRFRAEYAPEGDGAAPAADVSSFVWRSPSSKHRVAVSSIVPLMLPRQVASMPSRPQLNDAAPQLLDLIDAAEAADATLAIDPRIIAGIRAYGMDVPAEPAELLERLETTTAPTFLLQFADADPAAQAALGRDELLQPAELDYVTRYGTFAEAPEGDDAAGDDGSGDEAADAAEGDAEGAADADGEAAREEADAELPRLEELLEWGETVPTAWPAAGAVDEATMTLLRDSGMQQVVVDSTNVQEHAGGPRVELDGMDAVISDAALNDDARATLGGGTQTERDAGAAETASRLALQADAGTGAVIGWDRVAIAEADRPAEALEQIAALDWVDAVPVTSQSSGTAALQPGATDETRRDALRVALDREGDVTALSSLLVNPADLDGYQRARLLTLLGTRYASPDVDFGAVAQDFDRRDDELLQGVHIISTQHTQLLGSSSRVPLSVHNSLPFEAEVTGTVTAASAALSVTEPRIERTLVPADGNQTVLVPVDARVSSGDSGLLVRLADATGEQVFFSTEVPLSISSSVEKIALAGLSVIAALLLGFGIWRSMRRRRYRLMTTQPIATGISDA